MARKATPKLTLVKTIDLTGETRRDYPMTYVCIYQRIADGALCVKFPQDYFFTYGFDTPEGAETAVWRQLDSYVPPRDPVQLKAQAALDRWGGFVKKAEREAIEQQIHVDPRFNSFRGLAHILDGIEKRAGDLLASAPPPPLVNDLDMSDAEVAAAVRLLTKLDRDHAKERNSKGWGARDSSLGHWCCAMLEDHRAEAIQVARGFVGTYQRQLRFGGVI